MHMHFHQHDKTNVTVGSLSYNPQEHINTLLSKKDSMQSICKALIQRLSNPRQLCFSSIPNEADRAAVRTFRTVRTTIAPKGANSASIKIGFNVR